MADIKTRAHEASVEDFLHRIANDRRRADAFAVLKLMQSVTRKKPQMWGTSIVGFDQYSYTYANGKDGSICMIGFAPRSSSLTLYISPHFDAHAGIMKRLGKHTTSGTGGCVHIRNLADVDPAVLRELVTEAYRAMKAKHG